MAILRSRALSGLSMIPNPGVQSALQEWERKIQTAREAGRQSGLQEAQARIADAERRAAAAEAKAEEQSARKQTEFLARFEPLLTTITQVAARLEPLEKQMVQEAEAQIVRLALVVAATVLRRTIEHDPEWLKTVLRHALMQIPDRRTIAIRMHPSDAVGLHERIRELTARISGLENIEVIDDTTLPRGSCILQSRGTRLDASLPGCWERIANELIDMAPESDCSIVVRTGDAPAPGEAKP